MKYQKLNYFPLGSITSAGFLKEQCLRNKNGMGGLMDELEPVMIADPYINKTYVSQWSDGNQSGWGAKMSGNYWTGLIELAYTLNDDELIAKVTNWVNEMLKKENPTAISVHITKMTQTYMTITTHGELPAPCEVLLLFIKSQKGKMF